MLMTHPYAYSRRYVGPIKAVIFDWAGTMVDFGCQAPADVFCRAFAAHGVELSAAEARGPMGMEKRAHIATLVADPAIAARWRRVHGHDPVDADVDAMFARFTPLLLEALAANTGLIPGALDAVRWLRARGVKIGSNTGYSAEMMRLVTPSAAEQGYVPDCIVTPDEVVEGRPSPFMAFAVLAKLGVYPVSACVKVDDTPAGVEEGLNAGMWTVGVALSGNEAGLPKPVIDAMSSAELSELRLRSSERLARAGAHYVIDSVADLPGVVAHIEGRVGRGDLP